MILLLAAILPSLAPVPPDGAIKLQTPAVQYRMNEASATRSPWIDANGWRILRQPAARYYYDVPPAAAALAAAEAFVYGARASVHTDAAGPESFQRMVDFLGRIPDLDLPPLANIGVIDDGSDQAGELMNLLSRRNLLFKIVSAPDRRLDLNVRIGSSDYPKEGANNPGKLAQKIRGQLTDEKRLLRIYGSEVVVARLSGDGERLRIHLLNYSNRPVAGLRVRVLGNYPRGAVEAFGKPDLKLQDYEAGKNATEFTIPEMSTYVVIDLSP